MIGFGLYVYIENGWEPLPSSEIEDYLLRIVEDDGTIDEDFPAVDLSRNIDKFAFEQFAICSDIKGGRARLSRKLTQKISSSNIFLKIHVYSTLEIKQTTTISANSLMKMDEVLELICAKRKLDPADYKLTLADTITDVVATQTLHELNTNEFCLLKKDRGKSAGDIFLRPLGEESADSFQPTYVAPNEYTSSYKVLILNYRNILYIEEDKCLALSKKKFWL